MLSMFPCIQTTWGQWWCNKNSILFLEIMSTSFTEQHEKPAIKSTLHILYHKAKWDPLCKPKYFTSHVPKGCCCVCQNEVHNITTGACVQEGSVGMNVMVEYTLERSSISSKKTDGPDLSTPFLASSLWIVRSSSVIFRSFLCIWTTSHYFYSDLTS